MIDIGLTKAILSKKDKQIDDLLQSIKPDQVLKEITILEEQSTKPGFWNDNKQSQKVLQKIKSMKNELNLLNNLKQLFDDCQLYLEMYQDQAELETEKEIKQSQKQLNKAYDELRLMTLLNGVHDKENAIITLHAGAGGTEAQDWVEMLLRMYNRWAERRKLKFVIQDILPGDDAGIKRVTASVSGNYAYGYLQSEIGVHRLVRISPFDSSGRRHTSFASMEVIPEISDDITIDIQQDDLRIDTFRSSGAGGQHVNKTDSAIRITHIPTGTVVACQSERSQHQNKDYAMKLLMSKLMEMKEREQKEKIEDLKGVQKEIAWGSQIRSYVFCPYTMVKDHRTNFEIGDVFKVMDGDLDQLMNAYLLSNK
ncbi:MAG: peptide chain release factor 2 [Clostridiales bacterium]|nr:peptide chain release factor 2 [Clostridiales bacterium]